MLYYVILCYIILFYSILLYICKRLFLVPFSFVQHIIDADFFNFFLLKYQYKALEKFFFRARKCRLSILTGFWTLRFRKSWECCG